MYDLEASYYWLKTHDTPLSYTLRTLLKQMHSEVELGNFSTAWKCLAELGTARRIGDDYDQALVQIECALAAGKMHNPTLAQHELSEATMLLGRTQSADPLYKHLSAQAFWMLGNLLLPHSNTRQDFANTWEKSLRSLKFLAKYPHPLPHGQQWYLDRCEEMRQAITDATISYPSRLYLQKSTLLAGSLSYLDLIHDLPATGPVQLPTLSSPTDSVVLQPSLDEFRIAKRLYHLYNLRGTSRIIPLISNHRYLVLRVFNDAMARVGIDPGDYVLLEIKSRSDNGDIVLASVSGSENAVVLTTYVETNGRVILQPQSNNPDHQIVEVGPHTDLSIRISGIILGVFKSIDQAKFGREYSRADEDFKLSSTEERPIPLADILQTYPIYAEIPAGAPNTLPEKSDSYLELASFWINGKQYYLKNLRSEKRTLRLGSGEFPIVRVTGNSMNLANIDEGDYVILRRQNTAQSGDIVAAEIRDVDQTITLKRFLKRNSEVILQSESTNPVYREFRFNLSKPTRSEERPFYIQGIALAVLKPLP